MVFFNYSTMQMAAKVVYYGPGLCGKTTNLQYIYGHTSKDSRGEMVSLETETDRTLFFDLLPIDVGSIAGFSTRIQLYTVPGQVFYNTTRKLVLKGVDGVVFVADSQRPMMQANIDSFRNLDDNLAEMGISVETIPLVLQYNKRDLADICNVEDLDRAINRGGWLAYESSAITGMGVFETLKGISKLTLMSLKNRLARTSPTVSRPTAVPRPAPKIEPFSPPAAPPAGKPKPAEAATPTTAPTPAPDVAAAAPAPPRPIAASPQARPAPGFAPAPRPTAPSGKARARVDVLAELEKIRRQALRTTPSPAARAPRKAAAVQKPPSNGKGEINREIQLTLRRSDFKRAHHFLLSLQVEDGNHRVVDAIRDLQVDIGNVTNLEKVLLRLNIALNAKE